MSDEQNALTCRSVYCASRYRCLMIFYINTSNIENIFCNDDLSAIRQQTIHACEFASEFLPRDDNKIELKFFAGSPSPRYGVSACAPSSGRTNVYLHPETFYLRTNQYGGCVRFSAVIAHELHHNKRWLSRGYGETLGEMMVSEGLALKFQRETGHPDFPEERYLGEESLNSMAERAKPLICAKLPRIDENCDNELLSINRYALGLSIVEGWSAFAGISAASAHDVKAEEVLDAWVQRKFLLRHSLGKHVIVVVLSILVLS